PNNVDLARDVLFNISSFEHCEKALPRIDDNVMHHLDRAIDILSDTTDDSDGKQSVCFDQLIRIKALRAWILTQRNIAAWITGVHGYLNTQDVKEKKKFRDILEEMMLSEISNMNNLLGLFESGISFIALTDSGETPLMYSNKLPDQIRMKIDLMKKYGDREPYIDPDYIVKKAGMRI
ncbi:MAG: hypothetical protein J7L96_10175, partial [Bacteroidales bacterium]|nr:hypothetical protein [Bacteroidales bacterium]